MSEANVKYVPIDVLTGLGIRCADEINKVGGNPELEGTLKSSLNTDWWTAVSANMQLHLMDHSDDIRQRIFFRKFHELACEIWHEDNVTLTLGNIKEGHGYLKFFIESR